MPKVAVKSKDAVVNTVKDAKAVMKDTLVKKAVESKLGTEQRYSEPPKADTEASEQVESAAYTTADTVYHKGKTFTQNKVKEQIQKVKTRENETPENQEKLRQEVNQKQNKIKELDYKIKKEQEENINKIILMNTIVFPLLLILAILLFRLFFSRIQQRKISELVNER